MKKLGYYLFFYINEMEKSIRWFYSSLYFRSFCVGKGGRFFLEPWESKMRGEREVLK